MLCATHLRHRRQALYPLQGHWLWICQATLKKTKGQHPPIHRHDRVGCTNVHLHVGSDARLLELLTIRNPLVPENVKLGNGDPGGRRLLEQLFRSEDGGVVPFGVVSRVRRPVVAEPEHFRCNERDGTVIFLPGRVATVLDLRGVVYNGNDEELEGERDAQLRRLVSGDRGEVPATMNVRACQHVSTSIGNAFEFGMGLTDLEEPPTAMRDGLMPSSSAPLVCTH